MQIMSNQNVNMRTSVIPPEPAQVERDDVLDEFFSPGTETHRQPQPGPGNSGYSTSDIRSSRWSQLSNGGPRAAMGSLFADDELLSELPLLSDELEESYTPQSDYDPYEIRSNFTPRTPLDGLRMLYESIDPTKVSDVNLDQNTPDIPDFAQMYQQVEDVEYIKRFYENRIGLINDRIEHSQEEMTKTKDYRILQARRRDIDNLKRVLTDAKRQLVRAQRHEIS